MSFVFLCSNFHVLGFLPNEVLLSLSIEWQYISAGVGRLFLPGQRVNILEFETISILLNICEPYVNESPAERKSL